MSSRGSGYRDARPAPRRGLLDSLFAPKAPLAAMPKIRVSLGRGIAVAASTPMLAVGTLVFVAAVWLSLVAIGHLGSPYDLLTMSAIAPVGNFGDAAIVRGLFGLAASQIALLTLVVVRGALAGLVAGVAVDALRGQASRWSLVRGLRAVPAGILGSVLAFMAAFALSTVGSLLGAAFSQLIQLAAPILGLYLFGFSPIVAAAEGTGAATSLAKGVRAARLPGGGNVLFAAIFVLIVIFSQLGPAVVGAAGARIDVNASIGVWAYVFVINVLEVGLFVAMTYRYLSIADEVPEAPQRPARRGR
jgi:hypothetical protein